jgi:hypothetical protein
MRIVALPALVALGCGGGSDDSGLTNRAAYYVNATIDGKAFSAESADDKSAISLHGFDTAWDRYMVAAQGFTFGDARPRIAVESVGFFDTAATDDQRFQLFIEGSYGYGTLTQNYDDDDTEVPGINVHFWDSTESEWTCSVTAGDQSGSTFQVTAHEYIGADLLPDGTTYHGLTTGTFSCTLYSTGGSAMELKDATFKTVTATY